MAGAAEYSDCIIAEGQHSPNTCPKYDTKQFDREASVMLDIWAMQSTRSLSSLPGQLLPGVEASDRVQSMGQMELFDI